MFKPPGETRFVDQRPESKKEAVKVDERIADSRHVQRWTKGDPGRERFDTKEKRELDITRAQQDIANEKLHKQFDESAKDNHMKYERHSFVVVTSSDAYRQGWERMFGKETKDEHVPGHSTGVHQSTVGTEQNEGRE